MPPAVLVQPWHCAAECAKTCQRAPATVSDLAYRRFEQRLWSGPAVLCKHRSWAPQCILIKSLYAAHPGRWNVWQQVPSAARVQGRHLHCERLLWLASCVCTSAICLMLPLSGLPRLPAQQVYNAWPGINKCCIANASPAIVSATPSSRPTRPANKTTSRMARRLMW